MNSDTKEFFTLIIDSYRQWALYFSIVPTLFFPNTEVTGQVPIIALAPVYPVLQKYFSVPMSLSKVETQKIKKPTCFFYLLTFLI